jgi:hypothetical protein
MIHQVEVCTDVFNALKAGGDIFFASPLQFGHYPVVSGDRLGLYHLDDCAACERSVAIREGRGRECRSARHAQGETASASARRGDMTMESKCCESCGRPLPRFKGGDYVRLKSDGADIPGRKTLVFEVASVDLDDGDHHAYARLAGLDRHSRVSFDELEHAGPGEKPTGPRFAVGDKVKVTATLEQFGGEHWKDSWEIASGHTFLVKSVFHSPHSDRVTYGLHYVGRTIEEDWLSFSDEELWSPRRAS